MISFNSMLAKKKLLLSTEARALLIIIAGIGLRCWQIMKFDLWFDELMTEQFSFTAVNIRSHFSGISKASILWERISFWPDTFLFNFLVYIYSFFFGDWESMRYFSCFVSIAAMLLFYKICRQYLKLNSQEVLVALAFMTISPFQIWYAQEARGYAFSCFLTLAWFLCFWYALNKNRGFSWLLFIVLSILNLLTTYYAIFLIIIIILPILVLNFSILKKRQRLLFFSSIILACLFFVLFTKKYYILKHYFWLLPPGAKSMPLTFSVLIQGYSTVQSHLIIGSFLFMALFIFGSFNYYKQLKLQGLLYPCLFFLPLIVIFVISKIFLPLYLDRRFIIFAPFYYACLAKGICSIKNNVARNLIVAAVIFLIGHSLFGYYNGFMELRIDGKDVHPGIHRKTQYGALLRVLINELNEDEIVCTDSLNPFIIARRYFKRYAPDGEGTQIALIYYPRFLSTWEKWYLHLAPDEKEDLPGEKAEPLLLSFVKWKKKIRTSSALDKYKKIFLISAPWNETALLPRNAREVDNYLSSRCRTISVKKIDMLSVKTFQCESGRNTY